METEIHFRGRDQPVRVQGDVGDVADKLKAGGPVRLTTTSDSLIFVNWNNVLYIASATAQQPVFDRAG